MPQTQEIRRIEVVNEATVQMLRQRTAAQCVAMMGEANEMARLLSAAGVRHLHSDWNESQVQAEVARRMLA